MTITSRHTPTLTIAVGAALLTASCGIQGGVGDTDDRRDAELSGDDRGMALLCADLNDDTRYGEEQ